MDTTLDIMNTRYIDAMIKINTITCSAKNWHESIEAITPQLQLLVDLDYLVLYLNNDTNTNLDVMYAWKNPEREFPQEIVFSAEDIAHKVFFGEKIEILSNGKSISSDLPPIHIFGQAFTSGNSSRNGAAVFVKCCGNEFSDLDVKFISFITHQVGLLLNIERGETGIQITNYTRAGNVLTDELLSSMSHEIATPLGFIKGYTTTLMRADAGWDPKTQLEFLQIIDQETEHIESLVHNILDSAKLQSGKITMAFQPVRLDTIMNDVTARFHVRYPDHVITMEVQQPLKPIPGDPQRISQVFENIIGNAIKYAPHSQVWVRINQEEKGVHIEIEDKGPGIPPQYLPFIFEKYYRNPELSPSVHGSGLGLFICRQIINAHYGQLYVESSMDNGTTFHVILPYS